MTEAILGGLIGSVLTVLISRIFDMIQKKNEHSYALKKLFFERKLSVAEAAISQRYVLASTLRSFSLLLEQVSANLELILASPPECLKNYNDAISQQSVKLLTPAFDAANAVSLFFDVDESMQSATMEDILDMMMSIEGRTKVFQFLITTALNAPEKRKLYDEAKKTLEQLQAEIIKLSDIVKSGSQQVSRTIMQIRSEMKRFEP